MATIEDFITRFKVEGLQAIDRAKASIKGLADEAKKTRGALSGVTDDIADFAQIGGPLQNTLNGIVGRLGPLGVGAAAVGTAFVALGSHAINLAAGISDIAGATGIAEGTLLNFRTSVIEAGGSADDFGQIAAKLNQSVQDAASGNEKLQDSFRKLGVYVTDAEGKVRSTEDILRDITQRFRQGNLSAAEYSAALDLMGKNISKLDLQKLKAIADPVKTAEIQKLDEYAAAIDRVRDRLERSLLSFFGQLALDIDKVIKSHDELEKRLNAQGRAQVAPGLTGSIRGLLGMEPRTTEPLITRRLSEEERRRQFEAEQARLMAPAQGVPRGRTQEAIDRAAGLMGFGPKEPKKEGGGGGSTADSLQRELQTVKDLTAGYQRTNQAALERYSLQRQLIGASEYEKQMVTGRNEIEKRYADQIAALEAKRLTARGQTQALIDQGIASLETQKNLELESFRATSDAVFAYEQQSALLDRINQQIEQQIRNQDQLDSILRGINDRRVDSQFEESLKGLSPRAKEIARIQEEARKSALEAGRQYAEGFSDEDGLTPERAQELADGLGQIADGFNRIANERIALLTQNDEFTQGLLDSFEKYRENALDSGAQVAKSFENFTSGMEDAFVDFVRTGKLSFKDLANSILADLARIAVQKSLVFLGTSLFGFANGGQVMADTPIVVGERGPELFVPKTAGTIIANNKLGSSSISDPAPVNVTYNISAVDAASFRSLVARDPSFIYAVTEKGRQSQPSRRGI